MVTFALQIKVLLGDWTIMQGNYTPIHMVTLGKVPQSSTGRAVTVRIWSGYYQVTMHYRGSQRVSCSCHTFPRHDQPCEQRHWEPVERARSLPTQDLA